MRKLALLTCAALLAGCGAADPEAPAPAPAAVAEESAVKLPPLPGERRARVVEPAAGVGGAEDEPRTAGTLVESSELRAPSGPASATRRGARAPAAIDGSVDKATALPNGIALPPLDAPEEVLKVIEAGNVIARSPYKWGGGHGRFLDDGYDCSGSVSFALYAAGLIEGSRTSGGLMTWGAPGPGKWITIYTNPGHVFMVVAGIRFDTSGARETGSRWQNDIRSTRGYTVRHPPGL